MTNSSGGSSLPPGMTPETMAKAMDALHKFNVEAFTLLGIALAITALRSGIRVRSVGFKGLWADDYLVIVAAIFYSAETALAYSVGNKAHGLANNSMTDSQRSQLHPSSPEFGLRVLGSKIQVAGWFCYSSLLWALKGAMCTFYYRLTKEIDGYRRWIFLGFGFISVTWLIVVMNLFLSCTPLHRMWQISPDPGIYCQPAISPALIYTFLSFNVATDIYLILIPMPMLWRAAMPMLQRLWLMALFSLGLFVTAAAILRVVLLVSDPVNGAQLAGSWAVRETFVAMITTQLPVLFPYFKKWSRPVIALLKTKRRALSQSKDSPYPTTLDTWRSKRSGSRPLSSNDGFHNHPHHDNHLNGPVDDADKNESATNIISLQELSKMDLPPSSAGSDAPPGIHRQVELSVHASDREKDEFTMTLGQGGNYTSTWAGQEEGRKSQDRSQYFGDDLKRYQS